MKKIANLLILITCLPCFVIAQTTCYFEKLFTITPGMDMPSAVAKLQAFSKITLLNQTTDKFKPYANSGGDSILHETVIYHFDSSECLKGKDNSVKFEFADGKLYKAFLETVYGNNEFADMMTNFDFLHKQILQTWKYEETIKLQGERIQGSGYNFYKTQDKKAKLDMCTLQYIKTNTGNPTNDNYRLEIVWANLNNTRMENSMY
jgi:hypothetical protein